MALKFVVDTLDTVDEAHRQLYVEKDGKFVLGVEGAVSTEKLNEFRTSNVALLKERDGLVAKYKDVDLEAYNALTEQQRKLRDKELIEAGKVEELFGERTATMRTQHEKQLSAVAKERDTIKGQLEGLVIDGALRDAAIKHGVAPTAVDDVLLRGRATFKLVEGKAVAMKGDAQMFGSNGDPLDPSGWVASLQETAPHLFPASTGSGSRGIPGAGVRVGTVNRGDQSAFLSNIEKIAGAQMQVV